MSGYDIAGNFTRVYSFMADRDAGIKIQAPRVDTECDGFATAFNMVHLRDGRAPATGDWKMGTHKVTGLGNPTLAGDALCYGGPSGTPSSIDLTNATNLPLGAGGVTGILPVARGGTGSATGGFVTGMIMAWFGTAIACPAGWAICDGTAGTPDLRDRFIVGAGSTYAVGDIGGSITQTTTVNGTVLSIANLPAHDHNFADPGHGHGVNDPTHFHGFSAVQVPWNGVNNDMQAGAAGSKYAQNTAAVATGVTVVAGGANLTFNAQGGNTAHTHTSSNTDNRPPYKAMYYIMRL